MFAQRYGALIVAARTGGLVDTVVDLKQDPVNGTGYFLPELSSAGLKSAVADAVNLFRDNDAFHRARLAAMARDNSWNDSLDKYISLYRRLIAEN